METTRPRRQTAAGQATSRTSMMVWNWIDRTPRRVLALISLACVALLACGLYLQHVVGLVPCPMCIVQRYALIGLALLTGLASARSAKGWWLTLSALAALTAGFGGPAGGRQNRLPGEYPPHALRAGFGATVAARQSWLQWYPPQSVSCGRDFYGMIERFPLSRAIPMILRGSGDCTAVDWSLLGGSIANWSFLCFALLGLLLLALLARGLRGTRQRAPAPV